MGTSTRVLVRGAVSSHTARCVLRTRMAYAFALGSYKSANVAITPATQTSWRLSLYAHGCESTTQYGTDFRMLYCVRDSKVHARVGVYVSYVYLRSRSGCMLTFCWNTQVVFGQKCRAILPIIVQNPFVLNARWCLCLALVGGRPVDCVCESSQNQMAFFPPPPFFIFIFVKIWPLAIFQQKT